MNRADTRKDLALRNFWILSTRSYYTQGWKDRPWQHLSLWNCAKMNPYWAKTNTKIEKLFL